MTFVFLLQNNPYYSKIFDDILDNFYVHTYNENPELSVMNKGDNSLLYKEYSVNRTIFKLRPNQIETNGTIQILYCSGGEFKNYSVVDLELFAKTEYDDLYAKTIQYNFNNYYQID